MSGNPNLPTLNDASYLVGSGSAPLRGQTAHPAAYVFKDGNTVYVAVVAGSNTTRRAYDIKAMIAQQDGSFASSSFGLVDPHPQANPDVGRTSFASIGGATYEVAHLEGYIVTHKDYLAVEVDGSEICIGISLEIEGRAFPADQIFFGTEADPAKTLLQAVTDSKFDNLVLGALPIKRFLIPV